MLTQPNCCIQVALSINRATCCFDTSHSRLSGAPRVPSCTFGGQRAQTATFKGMIGTTGRAVLSIGAKVRRERRWTSAGATPARELVRSTRKQSKRRRRQQTCRSFRCKGSFSDSASVQAVT
jgi:hypothetical protein